MNAEPAPHVGLSSPVGLVDARVPAHVVAAPVSFPPMSPGDPFLDTLMQSLLVWEWTTPRALDAWQRLCASAVDLNEVRLWTTSELRRTIGDADPLAPERAERLRACLSDIFKRESGLSLARWDGGVASGAGAFIADLDGIPPFAAARASLVHLGMHAAPVDSRIAARLVEAGVVDAGAAPEEARSRLEDLVPQGAMLGVYARLQGWADAPEPCCNNGERA